MMSQSNEDKTIRVFIVEDHEMVRNVLSKLINFSDGLTLCGVADSAEQALELIPASRPDLVLADVSLPGLSGIELIQILSEKYPDLWLLALSAHDESVYGVRAIEAGARGYVMKDQVNKLLKAIRLVSTGGLYVSDRLKAILDNS